MLIRTESPADILVIDQLLKRIFPTEAEANLVMQLRENAHLTLSLVACSEEGEIVGHVMFSPVMLDEEDHYWQGLAPLAVAAEYRQQGIASSLVTEGLCSLNELGYPACVVLGDRKFYEKFGFTPAHPKGYRNQWVLDGDAFQIVELHAGALDNKSGLVRYCAEFDML